MLGQIIRRWRSPKVSTSDSDFIMESLVPVQPIEKTESEPVNDATLKVRVLAALHANPNTDCALLRVGCRNGVVTLEGEVDTLEAKLSARVVTSRQKGVRAIIDNITVVPLDEQSSMAISNLPSFARPEVYV